MTLRSPLPVRGVRLLAVLLAGALSAACDAPEAGGRAVAEARGAASTESVDVATARRVVDDFFLAFADGRAAEARDLLAAGPRSDASEEELLHARDAVRSLVLHALEPLRTESERIVFRATLEVDADTTARDGWAPGLNVRWVEVVHGRRGWRLARISAVPLDAGEWAPVTWWTQVHILEAGISLEVPHGWGLAADDSTWTWSPEGGGPRVAVRWRSETGDPDPLLLPGTPVSSGALEAGGSAAATEHLLQGDDGEWEAAVVIAGAPGTTVVLTARSARQEEMVPLRSVLRRMAQSVETGSSSTIRSSREHR